MRHDNVLFIGNVNLLPIDINLELLIPQNTYLWKVLVRQRHVGNYY